MNKQEIEKLFDDNTDRMTKHYGNAMSKEKFIQVVSELEAEKKELIDMLSKIMRSMLVHPDCVGGSEFDDQTSAANDLINKLKE